MNKYKISDEELKIIQNLEDEYNGFLRKGDYEELSKKGWEEVSYCILINSEFELKELED